MYDSTWQVCGTVVPFASTDLELRWVAPAFEG